MLSFIKKQIFIHKMIFKNFSILRIMQILEIQNINVYGSVIDIGSKESPNNVTNYLNSKEKLIYADKHSKNSIDLKIDLEEISELKTAKFDNVILFNVLEHIFNFKTCLNNCYSILKDNGFFYGSTPFLFRIHYSPNDYFRYTEQSILKILTETGFSDIKIRILDGGIFVVLFSSLSTFTNKLPLLNNLLYIVCKILDFIISLFSRNVKSIFPIGYFFQGKK